MKPNINLIKDYLDKTLKVSRILTMYDPSKDWLDKGKKDDPNFAPDATKNKYRIQIFLAAQGEKFNLDDYKKVLNFMFSFTDSLANWEEFEKLFALEVLIRMRHTRVDKQELMPLDREEKALFLESTRREDSDHAKASSELSKFMCSEVDEEKRSEQKKGTFACFVTPNYKYKLSDLWANSSEKDANEDANIWSDLYETLKKGYGTVGFEDFYGGICLRGGFIEIENGKRKDLSMARSNETRFKEKKISLEAELASIKKAEWESKERTRTPGMFQPEVPSLKKIYTATFDFLKNEVNEIFTRHKEDIQSEKFDKVIESLEKLDTSKYCPESERKISLSHVDLYIITDIIKDIIKDPKNETQVKKVKEELLSIIGEKQDELKFSPQ